MNTVCPRCPLSPIFKPRTLRRPHNYNKVTTPLNQTKYKPPSSLIRHDNTSVIVSLSPWDPDLKTERLVEDLIYPIYLYKKRSTRSENRIFRPSNPSPTLPLQYPCLNTNALNPRQSLKPSHSRNRITSGGGSVKGSPWRETRERKERFM